MSRVNFLRRATGGARTLALHAVLLPLAALVLAPLAWMAATAFKQPRDQFDSFLIPPGTGPLGLAWDRLTTGNFTRLFEQAGLADAMVNSVFLASVGSILAALCCAAAGHALAHHRFGARRAVSAITLAALVVPPPLLLAPTYEMLHGMGLLDTYAGLLLPAVAPAFGVLLFRQAARQSVPVELLEAARLDGCGDLRAFLVIVLPLLRPMIGAFVLITFLMWWNNFISPQVILHSPEKFPLAVAIAQLKGVYSDDYGLQMAATLLSVAPVMILFLLLQREFIAGLTAGAVKA